MDILLYGVDTGLVQAWQERLAFFPELQGLCSIMYGDIRQAKTDAVVSPANSFGFMDGGIDGLYSLFFGWGVQERLQERIKAMPMRELPVGCALVVPTEHPLIPWLVSAPTMRLPCVLTDATPAYLASKSAAIAAKEHGIKTLAFPGMGTGTGRLQFIYAADAMLKGIRDALFPRSFPESLAEAYSHLRFVAKKSG